MIRLSLLLLAPLLAACADAGTYSQGRLQPQSVSGPCQIKRFFFLGLRSVPTTMTVANTGQACSFVVINPALNAVVNAALLTGAPSHGQALPEVTNGRRQVAVSYTPVPGYAGPDRFDGTLEPGAVGITVNVVVLPAS